MTPDRTLRFLNLDPARISWLVNELDGIMRDLLDYEAKHTARINKLHHSYETSARNLLHYLSLLRHDLFPIRKALSSFGLSSLGRSESHVMASIIAVLRLLNQLLDRPVRLKVPYTRQVTYEQGYSLLAAHAESLFGPPQGDRRVRIMVTFSSEAAADYKSVRRLIENGMDCARINCAHDDEAVWMRMCQNVRKAEQETGRRCRILMDLAGPKLRTGPLAPGPRVLKIRPQRDELGTLVKPAQVWLGDGPAPAGAIVLPVVDGWHRNLKKGDAVVYRDTRGKLRRMIVTEKHKNGCFAKADLTSYIVPSTALHIVRRGRTLGIKGRVGAIPCHEEFLLLKPWDTLVLTASDKPGFRERRSRKGSIVTPATIPCTLPRVFADVKPGERIFLDDGKIGGIIESVSAEGLRVKITAAKPQGSKLRADKGINLPDSELSMSGLTEKDVGDLAFVAKHADIVALSFVRDPSDIVALHRHLARLGSSNLGVVLKIETRQAVRRLPLLLLSAMAAHPIGVMIARGDLAVELGFDNLADAQDEILLTCEAAHVPVIWATQVLENLAKYGMPSRAEISDAAMGVRADCVMLNKGEYIGRAVTMLGAILKRMESRTLDKIDYRKHQSEGSLFIGGLQDEKE
jgi:pyruvate kinase